MRSTGTVSAESPMRPSPPALRAPEPAAARPADPASSPAARLAPGRTVVADRPLPDSLSGHLPAWVRSRSGTRATGATTQNLRIAHAAFFAQATLTAAYKLENDDATILERLADGQMVAGL